MDNDRPDQVTDADGRARHGEAPRASSAADGSADELEPAEMPGDPNDAAEVTAPPAPAGAEGGVSEAREKYLRLAAEFDNYRKRSLRDRDEAGRRAQAELVASLLEPLDDLMRFAHLDPSTVDSARVIEGAALVERKINKALAAHGIEVLSPVDQPFDPAFHEAVGTEPALSREDDHLIAKVYQPGYTFRGQLLRPARVVVKQWHG